MLGRGMGERLMNRVKIYSDSSRNLGVTNETIINFSVSEMELIYWQNIKDLGDKAS